MTTYYATLELDPRSGHWMTDLESLAVHLGADSRQGEDVCHDAEAARSQAEMATARAGEARAGAARALVREAAILKIVTTVRQRSA